MPGSRKRITQLKIEAELRGDTTYFTGIACKHEHVAPRYVSDKSCTQCRPVWLRESRKRRGRR